LFTQVDGIIVSMANETVDLQHFKKVKQAGIPLITFDRGENDLNVDYIGIDDYDSSHRIVDHLVEQCCKRIAHIGGFKHTRIYNNRIRGYIDALEKHNLPLEKELLLESNLSTEDGRNKMQELLALDKKPDAVYVAGDYAALGALQVLNEKNIKIPDEIALVGFGDEPFANMVTPKMTSVNQHSYQIEKIAVEKFLEYTKQNQIQQTLQKHILKAELIIRESSLKKK